MNPARIIFLAVFVIAMVSGLMPSVVGSDDMWGWIEIIGMLAVAYAITELVHWRVMARRAGR